VTTNLLYALGTLSAWSGFALVLMAILSKSARLWRLGAGAVLLIAAAATHVIGGEIGIPLVWISMPFAAWIVVISFFGAAYELTWAWLDRSRRPLYAAIAWGVLMAAFLVLYQLDPLSKVEVFRGKILLSNLGVLGLCVFAFLAVTIMASLSRRSRPFARQIALVAGSVVFGLPFAWLLITSFKEDRDMASPSGIVWIPRVQRTVPYFDPENPLLEGQYRGDWVQVSVAGLTSDGSYVVEVQRPSSLRGLSFTAQRDKFKVVAKDAPVVSGNGFTGFVARELDDGRRLVQFLSPPDRKGKQQAFVADQLEPIRDVGLRTQNYTEALEAMPPETKRGLVYLKNTLILVVLGVVGTLLSCSLVAFGFARLRFPGREFLFKLLLATMMLPAAVTLMPQFLLFRSFGWIDTLYPLWVPAFFGSAFNVFLLRQFFMQVPAELEDAAVIDGASVLRTYWSVMLPQIRPALAVVAIWTFMGAWNNFMGPLLYVNSPENMPLSYALQLFQGERGGEPGLMMAFATLTIIPVVLLFFFAQRYFIEGVSLSGLGGR
jgi:multiple sugar transport system permease protein